MLPLFLRIGAGKNWHYNPWGRSPGTTSQGLACVWRLKRAFGVNQITAMFEAEQKKVEKLILSYCAEQGLPAPQEITWSPVPFSGEWGIATTFFQVAAQEARLGRGGGKPVPVRAQEIAAEAAASLGKPAGFFRVEAVKGYLNLYFAPAEFSRRVIDEALERGASFGAGAAAASW